MPTVSDTLRDAVAALTGLSPSPRLDAEVLVGLACGLDRAGLIAHARDELTAGQAARCAALVARRRAGEPVAHITGRREFWSLDLNVTPATLIPRPETERLVELALARIPADAAWRIADIGTGSGAIALALAHERPRCRLIATDISAAALTVARANAARLGIGNIEFREGAWLAPLAGAAPLDMLVSNPPYVRAGDPHLTQGDLRFEPLPALAAGADGLDPIRAIVAQARDRLRPGGWLLLEHGYDQGPAVAALLRAGGYHDIATEPDYAGLARVTLARRPD